MAVIAIAAGILLTGNRQAPLSGALGPTSTTLTLNPSDCSGPDRTGNMSFNLSGELRDSSGDPLGGRTIALRTASVADGRAPTPTAVEYATTGPDGG